MGGVLRVDRLSGSRFRHPDRDWLPGSFCPDCPHSFPRFAPAENCAPLLRQACMYQRFALEEQFEMEELPWKKKS